MADDGKIIPFPTDKIVNPRTRELDEQRRKMGEKVAKQIQEQQTKKFVETAVDDISMGLLKNFVDLAMKTNNPDFTKITSRARCIQVGLTQVFDAQSE